MQPKHKRAAVVAIGIGLLVLGASAEAEAKHPCTQASIQGNYGYTVTGTNVGNRPVAAVGPPKARSINCRDETSR